MALQMRDLLAGSIDTLQGDKLLLELLQASIESNLSTIFHMLINDIDLQALKPPTAAVEYAVRLAQRDFDVDHVHKLMTDQSESEPIDVAMMNGRYYISDGHHRAAAAKFAGRGSVNARVAGG